MIQYQNREFFIQTFFSFTSNLILSSMDLGFAAVSLFFVSFLSIDFDMSVSEDTIGFLILSFASIVSASSFCDTSAKTDKSALDALSLVVTLPGVILLHRTWKREREKTNVNPNQNQNKNVNNFSLDENFRYFFFQFTLRVRCVLSN